MKSKLTESHAVEEPGEVPEAEPVLGEVIPCPVAEAADGIVFTGSLTTIYDGYGTLILPDGTSVSNVRRMKLDQVVDDVIVVMGLTITSQVASTTYHFFTEDQSQQVFTKGPKIGSHIFYRHGTKPRLQVASSR